MSLRTPVLLLLAALALSACSGDKDETVARADDQKWTVAEAAALVAASRTLPPDPETVRALANLWIDYTLLAKMAAADSTMSQVDVSALVHDVAEEQLIVAFRDSMVRTRKPTPAELKQLIGQTTHDSVVRARHLLLAWPKQATPAQRDSVRLAITALRQRITEKGEKFSAVAMANSQDPASASKGGEMGFVGRGRLVPPLEAAIFSLKRGETSQPIESPYGLHLIQVEDRRPLSPNEVRAELLNRNAARAESSFVAELESRADPKVETNAVEIVREMARDPRVSLSSSDISRPLLRYHGGEVTQGEALRHLQLQSPEVRNQIAQSRDEATPGNLLRSIARRELVAAEAERRGWVVRREVELSLARAARANLADAAHQLGLVSSASSGDATRKQRVNGLLGDMLSGKQRQVTPLGPMSYALRSLHESSISEKGLERAAALAKATRSGPGGDSVAPKKTQGL